MNILLSAISVLLVSLPKCLSGGLGLLFVCHCKMYVDNFEGISSRRSRTWQRKTYKALSLPTAFQENESLQVHTMFQNLSWNGRSLDEYKIYGDMRRISVVVSV